jgi:hypothetical protein
MLTSKPTTLIEKPHFWGFRAGDGIRTHDLLLGKETFYQLNHARSRSTYSAYST